MWYSNDPRVRAIQVRWRGVASRSNAVCNRAVDCDPLGRSGGGSAGKGQSRSPTKKTWEWLRAGARPEIGGDPA